MLKLLFIKIRALWLIFFLYRNWLDVSLDRLPFLPKKEFVIYKLRNGLKIKTRTSDIDGRIIDNTFLGEYQAQGFEIGQKDVVVDIGAHIGSFTLYAALKAKSGKIYSFEPSSANFEILRQNVKMNKLSNISLQNLAVAGKTGSVKLYLPSASNCLSSLYIKQPEFEIVSAVTLEKIFSGNKIKHCDFLKIDCEGGEYDILMSAPLFVLDSIDKIACEFHLDINPQVKLQKMISYLSKKGLDLVYEKNSSAKVLFFKRNS